MKMSVPTLAGQELFVGAFLDDAPPMEDDNAIGQTYRAETVSDDECGASGRRALQRVDDRVLGDGIQTACGFVQNQNGRVAQHRAGDGNALLLASR